MKRVPKQSLWNWLSLIIVSVGTLLAYTGPQDARAAVVLTEFLLAVPLGFWYFILWFLGGHPFAGEKVKMWPVLGAHGASIGFMLRAVDRGDSWGTAGGGAMVAAVQCLALWRFARTTPLP